MHLPFQSGGFFKTTASISRIQTSHVVKTARGAKSTKPCQPPHVCIIKPLLAKLCLIILLHKQVYPVVSCLLITD